MPETAQLIKILVFFKIHNGFAPVYYECFVSIVAPLLHGTSYKINERNV
jgi:hypothetical protein